jgi:hypothetical protein
LFNPRGQAEYRLFTTAVPRVQASAACNRDIYVLITANATDFSTAKAPAITQRAIPLYQRLCLPFGRDKVYPTLTFRFVDKSFLVAGEINEKARVAVVWDGRTWQAQQATPVADTPPVASVAGQGLQMELSARLVRALDTGFPACQVTMHLKNIGGISVQGISVQGAASDANNTRLVEFRLNRSSQLPPQARATMRHQLPGTVCPYVQALKVDRIACSTRARPVPNCKPAVRLTAPLPAVETATTEETGISILY